MTTIAERVAKGAAFLDQHDPEWWRADVGRAIELDTLNLRSMGCCVLGQRCPVGVLAKYMGIDQDAEDELSAESHQAYRAYGTYLSGRAGIALIDWTVAHAFNADMTEFPQLTAEWTRVITERRSAS